MRKVLVVAPHCDDEILGVGATMCRHIAEGDSVNVLIATDASIGAPELFDKADIERVREEALAAHAIIGVDRTIFLDYPAPALDTYPTYKISTGIKQLFEELNPHVLYIPHPGDLHGDHKAIYTASLVAARPITKSNLADIYCYECLSESNWSPHISCQSFNPNVYVDISSYLDKKIEAMSVYKSQLKEYPHCRSLEGIRLLAQYRGLSVNRFACEAFELERTIR